MRLFQNKAVVCPECGYRFSTDNESDESNKTDESTSRTDGDDPANTGAETNKEIHPTNMKKHPIDDLTSNLVAAASKAITAKVTKNPQQPADNETAVDLLSKAIENLRK